MTWLRAAVIAALIGSCGKLPTTPEGVAFLEVASPSSLTIDVGDTVRFRARALDASGAPMPDVVILWRTPDTSIVSLEETTGLVTGLAAGIGRVQAVIGTVDPKQPKDYLASDFVSLTVMAAPSLTLALASSSLVIQQGQAAPDDVTLTRTNFTANVTLELEGAPAGVTFAFAPNPATATTSTLTITVEATVAPGDYPLTVRGTAVGLADRTVPLTLTVTTAFRGADEILLKSMDELWEVNPDGPPHGPADRW